MAKRTTSRDRKSDTNRVARAGRVRAERRARRTQNPWEYLDNPCPHHHGQDCSWRCDV